MRAEVAEFARFRAYTQVVFGPGAIRTAGDLLRSHGVAKALIVTDHGLVQAGLLDRATSALAAAGVEYVVFDGVEPNPCFETVERAADHYKSYLCQGILALGGGSPIDVAKSVGVLATNHGGLADYIGIGKVVNPMPPLLAAPTTVGTGSEVTIFAVITDKEQRKKAVIGSPQLAPLLAVLDPELVLSLPAELVASTGMDALTHAIESVISVFASPFTDGVALEAIRLITGHLPAAVASSAVEPRANLLYASSMAGIAFSCARTGLVHGMAHPLSSYCGVQHGLANAILLPKVLAFNAPCCESQLGRVAEAMGAMPKAENAIQAVAALSAEVGIPARLSEVGVTEKSIPDMAQDAYSSANAQVVNPRKPSLAEVTALYQQSL